MVATFIGDIIVGFEDDETLEAVLGKILTQQNKTISTAESCTGGLISSKIVSIPGSSAYFKGSLVAYSNEAKIDLLGVKALTLKAHGAVSEETVIEMAKGAIKAFQTDVAVSVSGIAGPDGGSVEKPVGTIWVCAGNKNTQLTYLVKSGKDREKNIEIASVHALNILRKFISQEYK